jgi:flagellar basal body-associated protein FliL
MASSLEIGKLVAVTFLYRYWHKTKGYLKSYLTIATIVLMLITSLGIFGYLSSAYQKSAIEFKANQEKIIMIESQKPFYTNLIWQSELRMRTLADIRKVQESRLSEAMTNAFLVRNPLQLKQLQEQTITLINQANEDIKSESGQMRTNQIKIMSINEEVNTMKFASAGKKDIQTFQFVAEQFGTTLDKVAKWFIFALIFVFDPLAIALILAYNIAVFKEKQEDTIIPITSPQLPKHTRDEVSKENIIVNQPNAPSSHSNVIDTSIEPVQSQIENSLTNPISSIQGETDPYWKRMFKL